MLVKMPKIMIIFKYFLPNNFKGMLWAYKLWGDLQSRAQSSDQNFYCGIASIILSRVLSLKFYLTLDQFDSIHQRNVVA